MGRRMARLLALWGLLALLCGCMNQSGEGLYALPQLPEDYLALQKAISQVISGQGAEYAAPVSGSNVQNIQLHDLDGDDIQESAVAFLRVPSAEKPLKIYIFRQDQATQEYQAAWVIEGDGTAIYSVAFENLGGTKDKEVVVSWQISAKVRSLTAYSLQPGGDAAELMHSGYARHAVVDLDRDNEKEIVLVQLDTAEDRSRAELYDYDNGLMVHTSTAPLSLGITEIQTARVGALTDMIPALFVSSDLAESGGRVTDIIALREGALTNLTLNDAIGKSLTTLRRYTEFKDVNGADINSDGVLELPLPETMPQLEEGGSQLYLFHWVQFSLDGTATRVCTTFHCYDDGWYLVLPESWKGVVTIARRDASGSLAASERAVSFYYWPDSETPPEEFLTIYRLTGSNRTARATIDERFTLFESNDVIYAAKLRDAEWDCGLDADGLQIQFNRIRVAWSTEN